MKHFLLSLWLGLGAACLALLSPAQAQTTPAKPKLTPTAARGLVAAHGKAIGRKFITKSKPTDMLVPVPLARPEVITRPQ